MYRRSRSAFLAGALLGAVLVFAGVAGAHSTQGGNDSGGMMKKGTMDEGMMQHGTMASMHEMMEMMARCNEMMGRMQAKHDAQPGNEQPATGADDAS